MTDRSEQVRRAYEDDELARAYERERSKNLGQRVRARLERSMLRRALAATPPAARILDVACGTGRLSGLFAGFGSYIGLDASAAMLGEARRAHASAGRWVRGDAARLPFASGSFDVVVSTRFLRHLDSAARIAIFSELARVSRGLVAVELLLGAGLTWRWKQLTHSREWGAASARQRPTHDEAADELARAGLRVKSRHALIAGISQPHVFVCSVD